MLQNLLGVARHYDVITAWIGRSAGWLILLSILVSAANAFSGWAFGASSNAWMELQWYLFTAAFMLAAPYTLQRNEHIRIDVVTGRFAKRTRDWIDVFGHIFMLLPFTLLMIWLCWPYFTNAWFSREVSGSANGLSLWPLRLVILLGFVLLFCQGLSELVKRLAILHGLMPDPDAGAGGNHAPPVTPIPG